MEIIQIMYVIPQAVILANNLLAPSLGNHGYYQVKYISGLWRNAWRPISFKVVLDYFGIGYVVWDHTDCLMSAFKMYYEKLQQIGK